MLISTMPVAGVTVAHIHTESLDAGNSGEARHLLRRLLTSSTRVVLDLSRLQLVDAAGLAALLSFIRVAQSSQAQICFCNLSRPLRAYFEMLCLHNVVPVYESREEALFALTGQEMADQRPLLVTAGA